MPSTKKETSKPGHVTKGDVFDDLGLSHAEAIEAKVKSELWRDLVDHIRSLGLSQKELAKRLKVYQPDVSNLLNGKLSKFSAGTLIHYAAALDIRVQVKLTAPKTSKVDLLASAVKSSRATKTRGKDQQVAVAA